MPALWRTGINHWLYFPLFWYSLTNFSKFFTDFYGLSVPAMVAQPQMDAKINHLYEFRNF